MSRSPRTPQESRIKPPDAKLSDKATFLLAHKWRTLKSPRTIWSWYDPDYPGALYTLDHAYDVVRGQK